VLKQQEDALEYEQLKTLATVRDLGRVGWDAMGELLLVEVRLGKAQGPLDTVPVCLTAEVAEELQAQLRLCLLEKEAAANTRQ